MNTFRASRDDLIEIKATNKERREEEKKRIVENAKVNMGTDTVVIATLRSIFSFIFQCFFLRLARHRFQISARRMIIIIIILWFNDVDDDDVARVLLRFVSERAHCLR